MTNKPLPIGIDDFKELMVQGYYYIDKTSFVSELLDKKGKVNLFTRPRRFGKTLNMSMFRYFFEDTGDEQKNQQNRELFNGLKITSAGDKYTKEMTQYPVISLSLKSAKQPTWELAYACLKEVIENEFQRHRGIIPFLPIESDREKFERLVQRNGTEKDYITALAFLSEQLMQYYGKAVIILIDEYDVPLENAHFCVFYERMVNFIRSLFESALKTNPSLHFAVITGCLRITKESIFTGLNNLKINSILGENYGEYFGFTSAEIKRMLKDYGCEEHFSAVRNWYDGYIFGTKEVYNPWSVLNYAEAIAANPKAFPKPYWSNTSSNSIIHALIERADLSTRMEIESLIAGDTVTKPIHEDITYEDVYSSMDNLWNFLFFTGYLKKEQSFMDDNKIFVEFSIPNIEIKEIYKEKIVGWFKEEIKQKNLSSVYQHMLDGAADAFEEDLANLLQDTISFYDNAEAFYHGFVLGILSGLRTYIVKSNREAGNGRYDILVRSLRITKPLIILEFKVAKSYSELEAKAAEALKQIETRNYDRGFSQEGYRKSIRYGIAFCGKNCLIQKEEIDL